MGYCESSKDYKIYFPGFKKIDISKEVTVDEDTAYNKSRKRPAKEPKEEEAPIIHDTTMNEETREEDREFQEPQRPVDPPMEKNPHKRKPTWVRVGACTLTVLNFSNSVVFVEACKQSVTQNSLRGVGVE